MTRATARLAAPRSTRCPTCPQHVVQPVLQQSRARRSVQPPPDDPVSAREWLDAHHEAPLSELHEFIVRARDAEKREPLARRQDWQVTRAAAHAVLAQRGSRVALYDLRETFDAAHGPLPLDFLTRGDEGGRRKLPGADGPGMGGLACRGDLVARAAGRRGRRHHASHAARAAAATW